MATEAVRRLCVSRPWRVFDQGVMIGRTESSDTDRNDRWRAEHFPHQITQSSNLTFMYCVDVAKLTLSSYQSPSTKSSYP
jgi:hypothetical protein